MVVLAGLAVIALLVQPASVSLFSGYPAGQPMAAAAGMGSDGPPGDAEGSEQAMLDAYQGAPISFEANRGQTDSRVDFLARGAGYSLFLTPTEAVLSMAGGGGQDADVVRPATVGAGESSRPSTLRMRLLGGNPDAPAAGKQRLPGTVNYFSGGDRGRDLTGVQTFGRVAYQGVYPGVDLAWHGNQGRLQYDFLVAPGVDPSSIELGFEGVDGLRLDGNGDLLLAAPGGQLRMDAPVLYQDIGGDRRPVAGRFVRTGERRVGFAVGDYDASRPLVIDPRLAYSSYLGGSDNDGAYDVAVDRDGNAYITGTTCSPDFPTRDPAQDFAGAPGCSAPTSTSPFSSGRDAFVTKLVPRPGRPGDDAGPGLEGSAVVYSTYLGGSAGDVGRGIAVDRQGSAYVTGPTGSADFPTTRGALATAPQGGIESFVTKLDPSGSALAYSTYLGGGGYDQASGIAVDGDGNAHVAGSTQSTDFPTTAGAYQRTMAGGFDAFVTKLDADGSDLSYSTYLGGTEGDFSFAGVDVDEAGTIAVAGNTESADFPTTPGAYQPTFAGGSGAPISSELDIFVTQLDPAGNGSADLVYSTYLGGAQNRDFANGVASGPGGTVYLAGTTFSHDFPTTPGAYQTTFGAPGGGACAPAARGFGCNAFMSKLDPAGNGAADLVYSTFLGGSKGDQGNDIAVDSDGNALVTGYTVSRDFPTADPIQGTCRCPGSNTPDGFVSKLDPAGNEAVDLVFSTFLGGDGDDQAEGVGVDGEGNAYVAGFTNSPGRNGTVPFPTTPGAFQDGSAGAFDAFVVKIDRLTAGPPRGR